MYTVYGERDDRTVSHLGNWATLEDAQRELAWWKARGFFHRMWIQ